MKQIEGFISDQINNDEIGEYVVYRTYRKMMTKYSHYDELDPKTYKEPQLYIKEVPSFDETYEMFMSYNSLNLTKNRAQDICLSLFYNPYFEEIYDKIRKNYKNIPKNKLRYLAKKLFECLADPVQYRIIVEINIFDKPTKNYYIEKDIFNKSNELLKLINT